MIRNNKDKRRQIRIRVKHKQQLVRERRNINRYARALRLLYNEGLDLDGIGWVKLSTKHYFIDQDDNGRFSARLKTKDWVDYTKPEKE